MKLVRLFSRLNVGGPTLHVVNLTKGLEDYGYETELVVGKVLSDEGDMSSYATEKHVVPVCIPEFQAPISPLKDFLALIKIILFIRREKPTIVHTHTFKAGLLGRIAAWVCGVPVIIHTYHGHLLEGYGGGFKKSLIKFAEKNLARITDKVITVSDKVSKDIVFEGIVPAKKMQVIELGFDFNLFLKQKSQQPTLRKNLGISKEDIVVGIAGRLVTVKSVDLFLRAMVPLLKANPRLKAVVVGEGPEKKRLVEEFQHSQIYFHDFMLPWAPELRDLDILVCSSKNEGTSVSVIEAMLAGTPVISTNVGGMGDLLGRGQWGTLVPYDESYLRSSIAKLVSIIGNPSSEEFALLQRKLENTSRHTFERFNLARLLDQTAQLYRRELEAKQYPLPLQQSTEESLKMKIAPDSTAKAPEQGL